MYYQLKELSKSFDIYLAALSHDKVEEEHFKHISSLVKEVKVFRIYKPWALLGLTISYSRLDIPAQSAYFYAPGIKRKIHSWMDEVNPDRVYYQLIRTLPYHNNKYNNSVLDLMDAFSTGAKVRAENTSVFKKLFWKREAKLVKSYEQWALKVFNKLTIISDLDKTRVGDSQKITVINNGIDARFYEHEVKPKTEFDAVFVGNLGYYPNVKAVEYISRKIVPELKDRLPDIKINIVGPNKHKVSDYASNNVTISGWYDNVIDGYYSGKIFLAPLFEGIGQQNKILEAMALGIPCITTPDVANALRLEVDTHVLVAENAQAFVDAIEKLLNDSNTYDSLKNNAKSFVAQHYKWESVTAPLIDLLKLEN